MLIAYRRTGGVLALLTLAVVAVAATLFTIAVGATLLIGAAAVAAVAFLARSVLPASRRRRNMPPASWAEGAIEGTLVTPAATSDARDLVRLDSDKG
jgi:hypothetical protein